VPIEGAVLFKLPSIVEKYANPLVAEWEYVSLMTKMSNILSQDIEDRYGKRYKNYK
jgi:hypothetical protein